MFFFKNSLHQNKCCQGVAKGIVIILEDASLPKDLMNAMLQKLHFPVKMNSLYQILSKMLHGTKVIISVGKKIEKEVAWLGFELTTFILEVETAYHYTMDPS